jgi:type VI secretion system protein ImpH
MSSPLEQSISSLDFFRAVRLIDAAHPDLPRTGSALSPRQECIRFGQRPELAFATSTIDRFHPETENAPPRLDVNFFGLFGPNGPLPLHLTEYARDRLRNHGDDTFVAFANIFHHRLTSLFYRAWAVNQLAVDLDRPQEQRFSHYIGSFFGIGMDSLQDTDAVPTWSKLSFAGRLAAQTRNVEGLESILSEFFAVPAEVVTFVGRWIDLPTGSLCRLGESPETGSLGLSAVVGSQVWDCQLSIRLRFGPMSLADYERLLPGGTSFERIRAWVLNYVGQQFFWDLQLVLRAADVPPLTLGGPTRLGWTTWLCSQTPAADVEDLVVNPPES